ncbi:glucose-fructose oxidoreductase [Alteromonadaceae bacterium 2753L.S.0a.02]|nr:glucose-fructose oxidoreductase [Alteromonadaceae bacterium 2753L.S.0a.02]
MKKYFSRRQLIKQGITAAGVVAATGFNPLSIAMPVKKKIGVALVGLGYYSRDLLAPALQLTQYCELRGIVTGSPEKIPVWQKKYGIADKNIYNYETMHEVANNPDIDVLYIVVPTSLHEKYAVIAANAGKHVWCEKPMAMDEGECQRIIDACNKNHVQLTVGYRLRHEPNTRTVMSYADQKPYGKIKDIIAQAGYAGGEPDPSNWRLKRAMGGGALYDMGVYPINAARFTSGLEPIAVTARLEVERKSVFKEVDESAYLSLEFPGGITAECATSVGKNMNLLRANCEKGWYELSPMQSYSGVQGKTSTGILLNKTIANQQAKQMDDDAIALFHKSSVLVPGEVGLGDIRVVTAALKSAATGKRVEI